MAKLTDYMQNIVEVHKLGFVATVCEDGTPNLSPKGTCLVLDDEHIMFGEIRSPNTRNNIRERPVMEMNFVDVLSRKGFRAKGRAEYLARGTPEFGALLPRFAQWGELSERIKGIVKLRVEEASLLSSPAYDIGASEEALKAQWKNHFQSIA
ncbi:MAG: pyridoxamine 5'-phosphate oxidase family protein [Gammaproteobacteria bacterium]|nr:pyridoxamine 5'-phosphate oxidase family protein [Gammaproteobacteria bacterium]